MKNPSDQEGLTMNLRGAITGGDGALRLIEMLLPVLDGIEAAIERGEAQLTTLSDSPEGAILAGWLEGQQVIHRRLLDILEREGVRPIPAVGHPFDPRQHRAVERVSDPTFLAGTVVAERRKGYRTTHRILRYAEVVVVL